MVRRRRTLLAGVGFELAVAVDGAPIGRRPHCGTIAGPGHGRDRRHGIAQRHDLFAGGDVPDLELAVGTAADHLRGVGVEGRGDHLRGVPLENGQGFGSGRIPDLDQRVTPGREQAGAIPAEFEVEDGVGMGLPGSHDPTVGHAHPPHIAGESGATVAHGHLGTVDRELQTHHAAREPRDHLPLDRQGLRIPESHLPERSRGQTAAVPAPRQRLHRVRSRGRRGQHGQPRPSEVVDGDRPGSGHGQSMPLRVECQGGHGMERRGHRLQHHGPGLRFIAQHPSVPGQPPGDPLAEGLDLPRRELFAGRHVVLGSRKHRREQAAFLRASFLDHGSFFAALEHLLAGQQGQPGLLLGLAMAGEALVAQEGHRLPPQRLIRGGRQHQGRDPEGPQP